jgi:hypothetical protein
MVSPSSESYSYLTPAGGRGLDLFKPKLALKSSSIAGKQNQRAPAPRGKPQTVMGAEEKAGRIMSELITQMGYIV